jgi:diacylglycerol kinase family enzyme
MIGMSNRFSKAVLVANHQSGSFDAKVEAEITALLAEHDVTLAKLIALPDDDVPDRAALESLGADLLIVWTGDGTINAAAHLAEDWNGALLALPGGTLNLLSKSLHGDRGPVDILRDALAPSVRRATIPILEYQDRIALITILAGPATQWADVRETMRQEGVVSATREAPEALDAMLNAPGVSLNGKVETYPVVILTPTDNGIDAHGILTGGTWDILRHGLAWLGGDFRDGPSDHLGKMSDVQLESAAPISVEFDGELMEIPSPAKITLSRSRIDFVITA